MESSPPVLLNALRPLKTNRPRPRIRLTSIRQTPQRVLAAKLDVNINQNLNPVICSENLNQPTPQVDYKSDVPSSKLTRFVKRFSMTFLPAEHPVSDIINKSEKKNINPQFDFNQWKRRRSILNYRDRSPLHIDQHVQPTDGMIDTNADQFDKRIKVLSDLSNVIESNQTTTCTKRKSSLTRWLEKNVKHPRRSLPHSSLTTECTVPVIANRSSIPEKTQQECLHNQTAQQTITPYVKVFKSRRSLLRHRCISNHPIITSRSQESNTPGKFLSHDVNHTSSCDHRDSEDETNEKVIVLKNNNIEDYKINEVKAVNKNLFGSEKCVSEGDESWFIIPPTGIDGPCSQNQNSTYSSISSIVSDFTSMSHSVGKSTGSHKSLMNTFYTPTMKRRNRLPIPSEFLNSTSSGPVIYKPTTRSSMTNMYSELNKSSDQDSGLSSQLSSTFRSTDVETQSRDIREHRNLVGSSASWATTLRQSMKKANNKRTLLAGCTLFNRNPVEGVNYLIRNYILLSDPIKIAQFLFHEPNLNRQAIGEYFGLLDNTLAMKVLKEFLLLINMKNMEVDVALRSVIGHFHPSGESQKIAHLMKIFHEVYIIQNPDRVRKNFHSPETVEVLAYSVLLLHTDLHNPNVGKMGKRMTKQGFINNNRGIDSDHDVSTDLLEGIYDRIAASEFKTLPDPSDKLRALDGVLVGPLKTDNFVQRHRRFIGRILTQEIEKIAPRKLPGRNNARWRHLLIFNDILVVVKSLNTTRLRSGSLINSVAVVAFGDQNGTRHYAPRNSVSRDDSSCSPFGPVQDVTQKVFCSTEPFATDTTFQVRSVYPFLDLRVLVFESNYYRYGVQLCNSNGPVISLNMPSEACRRQFIDWAYGSIAEMEELQQHQQVKKSECERTIIVNCKRSPTKTTANGTISIINGDRCVMPSSRVTEKVILFNT